ncbi:tripartite motif-containing protein 14-like [Rana temporaria]|uniref:tripartite motif-containing protein 14-like n=1 Tax=Rana temporaria TaxID=8407 RepID=UPI001AADDC91|nr:tripartite motif-containing protein 14-like [Rana temporaria]
MASTDLRAELECSVCLNIYTDPVNLKCGHNFCWVCINRVLDTQEGSGDYFCPLCRKRFRSRPVLHRNVTLRNIVENCLSVPTDEEESGVVCTYCVDYPVPAVRSCLHCEVSLCDKHLRVHKKSPEHILCDPTLSMESRKCSVHNKILEYYCTEDGTCICVTCRLDGEHRGHQVEMLDEASEKKKETLRYVLSYLLTKREETEKRVQSLQEHRRKVEEEAAGDTERVTVLFRDLRRRLEDLEKRVLREISGRGAADILLDVNTAGNKLHISDDRKMLSWSDRNQKRPETPERFTDYPQVLSSQSFSSGRHYWDVDVGGSLFWRVGMCYPSMDRNILQAGIGKNNKSWGFLRSGSRHFVRHDSKETPLPANVSSKRVRIDLDYEAGRISFYDLCDPIRHLHTFTTTFTEPLHAGLCLCKGCIKICGGN